MMEKRKVSLPRRILRRIRGNISAFDPDNPRYKWWLLANVMIGTFMAVLDATIVNVGLPKIMSSFGVGIDKIEWVVTGYMIAMALMLPTSAWLADKYGYKRMYLAGITLFTFGSFLCGISGNENFLITSRVIQGLGGGMLMPLGMAIIMREFPPARRGTALGFWAISAAASVSFGPLIGGFLVDKFSWKLIFDVNVPVGIFGIIATLIIQNEYRNPATKRFDLAGFISASIFLPLLLYALTESASTTNTQGWSSPVVLVCLVISFIALIVFVTNEFVISHPLMDLRLLGNRNFGISSAMILIFGIGMFGSTFLLPVYLQNSLGYTAIQAGAVFLPVGIIQGITSPISGWFSDRTNPKIPVILGLILLSSSFFVNSRLSYLTEHSYIMLSLFMRGLGMGMLFTPLSSVAVLELHRDKMAQAAGLSNIIRQIGGSFGVALLATLLTTRMNFHQQMFGQAIDPNSPQFIGVMHNLSSYLTHVSGADLMTAGKLSQSALMNQVNKEAYIQAIDDDFLLAGVITLIGVIPAFLLHSKRKAKQKQNDIEYGHQVE